MLITLLADEPALIRLSCEGEISQNDFQAGQNPLEGVMGPDGFSRRVLLNLEKTTYIDTTGISWMLVCHKRFVENKGKIIFHSIPPRVYQILQIVRMPLVLHLAPDEAAARAAAVGESK